MNSHHFGVQIPYDHNILQHDVPKTITIPTNDDSISTAKNVQKCDLKWTKENKVDSFLVANTIYYFLLLVMNFYFENIAK